jgi:hypothetical protein
MTSMVGRSNALAIAVQESIDFLAGIEYWESLSRQIQVQLII